MWQSARVEFDTRKAKHGGAYTHFEFVGFGGEYHKWETRCLLCPASVGKNVHTYNAVSFSQSPFKRHLGWSHDAVA